MRGKFITLEGLEGVGKTTNRQCIEDALTQAGIDFIAAREPGGTPTGEALRELVLHARQSMCAETELLIMLASRMELIAQRLEPALASGQWVLCDRFLDASVAYQGAGRKLGVDRVLQLHALMGVTLTPDLTILLDMPVEEGLSRMAARSTPDRIEREELAFFTRARKAYLEQARAEPDRIRLIDATGSRQDVAAEVKKAVLQLIETSTSGKPAG